MNTLSPRNFLERKRRAECDASPDAVEKALDEFICDMRQVERVKRRRLAQLLKPRPPIEAKVNVVPFPMRAVEVPCDVEPAA